MGVVVAFGIQHAMCMGHIVICGLPGCTLFFTLSKKRHDFRKKKFSEHKMCFDFLYNFFEKFLILRKTERDMTKNAYWCSCKVLFVLVRF